MSLLPVFLKLDGRPALVVGAGTIAMGKAESLVAAGTRVTVVAPEARAEIRELAAQGTLTWHAREFQDADLDGQFVVVAGTNRHEVNQHIYRLCRERGIICNAVDDPPHCDFYYGSVVSRGDLQIAISTAGESPAVAQRLRREIDAALPHDLGPWLASLGTLRRDVLAAYPAGEPRKQLLHQLASRDVCNAASCPTRQVAFPATTAPKVYLVGAGPGDPDLLTVKAARLLAQADILLHDDLVPAEILALASPHAEITNVGKRCGAASITQPQINSLLVRHVRAGHSVVRLKSGDPMLFGRVNEEIEALQQAGVDFEIVSGVTAASAAAAAIPCSLTDRLASSSVLLSTGHNAPHLPLNEEPTRVVYMPGRNLEAIAHAWIAEGLPLDFPCVLVSRAGQREQHVVHTTLDQLAATEAVAAPSLLMGGAVFGLRTRGDNDKLAGDSAHSSGEQNKPAEQHTLLSELISGD